MSQLNIKATRVFQQLMECKKPFIVLVGGSRSSKSYSIAQYLLLMKVMQENNKKILILRKSLPSLKRSTLEPLVSMMKTYKMYYSERHNKSEGLIRCYNQNTISYAGLDDPDKIKSTEYNYIWMEEADEFAWEDFIQLKLRMSGKKQEHELNQMILSLNPSDDQGWVKRRLVDEYDPDVHIIHSTYRDNPFLDDQYVKELEKLASIDETYWNIYGLGQWGNAKGVVYSKFRVLSEYPHDFEDFAYGLDFGFNNPTALVSVGMKDRELYIKEELYESGLTTADLVEKLKTIIKPGSTIIADAAEPDRIEEICRAGFDCRAADKSVKNGIDAVKTFKLNIHAESANLQNEIKSYRWKLNRLENPTDEVVKYNDHLMDAMRYVVKTYFKDAPGVIEATVFGRR